MRIAAIDIGTNSIHVVIAQAASHQGFEVLDREREVVQVGRGSFSSRRLRPEAIRRTVDALARFVALARRHRVDQILCTATAAVREAPNGGDFVKAARQAAGITPRVIPAREEGRLIYLAVKSALELGDRPSLLLDIGGGSAQFVVGTRQQLVRVFSVPLGALRLSELFPLGEPPGSGGLAELRRHIRKVSREALRAVVELGPERVYGSSGSIHALAHVTETWETGVPLEQLNGHFLNRKALDRAVRRLEEMTLPERERAPGIDAQRAEIIVPGALVLQHVLEEVGADGITMSDFGVREGLVTDYLSSHAREIDTLGAVGDLKLRSVLQLLEKFPVDDAHTQHVVKLSLQLFDAFRTAHDLGDDARRLLHFAALLHDVGSALGHDGHAEHSFYIIRNGNLRGLDADEIGIVALVARYHGKSRPRKRDGDYRALARRERRTVRWLAALLRIAEALDRSQYQLIQDVRLERRGDSYTLRASAQADARLEIWAARQRTGLLARLLGGRVRITLASRPLDPGRGARAQARAPGSAPPPRVARAPARPGAESAPGPRPNGRAPKSGARAGRRAP